jgi:hypothetical protein
MKVTGFGRDASARVDLAVALNKYAVYTTAMGFASKPFAIAS